MTEAVTNVRTPAPYKKKVVPLAPQKETPKNMYSLLESEEEESSEEETAPVEKPKVVRKLCWADYDSDSDSD